MDKSVIILAIDGSGKFGEDKGLLLLDGKPLLKYVVDAVKGIAEETIIVTSSKGPGRFLCQNRFAKSQVCL